jgi:glycoprotein 2-beta-D-xylosyltransferase
MKLTLAWLLRLVLASAVVFAVFNGYAYVTGVSKKPARTSALFDDVARPVFAAPLHADVVDLWSSTNRVPCAQFFANNFFDRRDLCPDSNRSSCFYSPALKSSHCRLADLLVDAPRVNSSRGGEPLDDVAGRDEDAEFPRYPPSSLRLPCAAVTPGPSASRWFPFHLARMVTAIGAGSAGACDETFDGVTFILTRYEYANLFHTLTDFYNVYQLARIHKVAAPRVAIFDGHARGGLDDVWGALFPDHPILWLRDIANRSVCFRDVVLVHAGYSSPLSVFIFDPPPISCAPNYFVKDFANFILRAYGLEHLRPPSHAGAPLRVVLELREPRRTHPRQRTPTVARRIANAASVVEAFGAAVGGWGQKGEGGAVVRSVEFLPVRFSDLPFVEQLHIARSADVLVGLHGAGLSHALFLDEGAALVEIVPVGFSAHAHFRTFAEWGGAKYRPFYLQGDAEEPKGGYELPAAQVVSHVREVVRELMAAL